MARNGVNGKVEYRKEFFDRDYSVREAYARVWNATGSDLIATVNYHSSGSL